MTGASSSSGPAPDRDARADATSRLGAYFTEVHPSRSSLAGRLFFRHGEQARIRLLRELLPPLEGCSLLDAGCGDGVALAAALAGRPSYLQLEDVAGPALEQAAARLSGAADTVRAVRGDVFRERDDAFDVVVAVGMLDYQRDVERGLRLLLARTRGTLIATVPARGSMRNWLRVAWLGARGIPLQLAGRERAAALGTGALHRCRIVRGPYEWFLHIRRTDDGA